MPIWPTFWNERWSAITAPWHLPDDQKLSLGDENGCGLKKKKKPIIIYGLKG